ncbi:MAG: DUF2782 domain-containing protein [Betaproteobacteria bacterium]|nr:DUF2782 domain-containing protein [Betaproteobacteria bacterium]
MTRKPFRLNLCLLTAVLAATLALPAAAQTAPSSAPKKPPRPANLEKLEDVPPPPNTLIDPKVKPEETIREEGGKKIIEYRMKGRLYKMRVIQPDGKSYWLIDPKGDGKFIQDEKGVAPTNSVPMWVVYEW